MRFLLVVALVAGLAAAQNTTTPADFPTSNTTIATDVTTAPAANVTANVAPNVTQPALLPTAASVPVPVAAKGQCAKMCVRKEFRALSHEERLAFLAAVKKLQTIPATGGPAPAVQPPRTNGRLQRRQDDAATGMDVLTPNGNNTTSPNAALAAPHAPTVAPPTSLLAHAPIVAPVTSVPAASIAAASAPGPVAPLNGPSEYDRFAKMHIDASKFSHGTDYFLPWHRAYLREFELALQRIDPSICLPYWNWSLDSQAPEFAPLLVPEYFGGNGQGADNCVQDGVFAGFRPAYPQPHCLSRAYAYDGTLGAFYSVEAVNRAVSTVSDYSVFRRQVEGVLHPNPHIALGGDMSTMASPNDPLFFLHHGMVDYIWSNHQKRNGLAFSGDANTAMPTLESYRVGDVLDQRQLCYEYGDLSVKDLGDDSVVPPPPPPSKKPRGPRKSSDPLPDLTVIKPLPTQSDADRYSSRDRSNLVSLRYADPVSKEWCDRNNIPYEDVRSTEDDYRTICTQLNQIKGYVSPCALMKRPTLQARIIQTRAVKDFYVDVPDVGRVEIGYNSDTPQTDTYQAVASVNQRVYACAPDVERPAEEYRATVQKLIGPSAFSGASDPLRITDMDHIQGAAPAAVSASGVLVAIAATVAAAVLAQA